MQDIEKGSLVILPSRQCLQTEGETEVVTFINLSTVLRTTLFGCPRRSCQTEQRDLLCNWAEKEKVGEAQGL